MKQLIRSAAVTESGRGAHLHLGVRPPPPPSVGMYMEKLDFTEEWKHSGTDQSPNISAAQYCLEGFPSTQDAIYNSMDTPPHPTPPPPRFRDEFNWIKEGLPQNFVPAVTAPVPLTAVQVTDANLLKSKKKERLTSSSLEESATAAPCAAASLRFHLSTLPTSKRKGLESVLKLLADSITSRLPSWIKRQEVQRGSKLQGKQEAAALRNHRRRPGIRHYYES